jgi:hypothetical protein
LHLASLQQLLEIVCILFHWGRVIPCHGGTSCSCNTLRPLCCCPARHAELVPWKDECLLTLHCCCCWCCCCCCCCSPAKVEGPDHPDIIVESECCRVIWFACLACCILVSLVISTLHGRYPLLLRC